MKMRGRRKDDMSEWKYDARTINNKTERNKAELKPTKRIRRRRQSAYLPNLAAHWLWHRRRGSKHPRAQHIPYCRCTVEANLSSRLPDVSSNSFCPLCPIPDVSLHNHRNPK